MATKKNTKIPAVAYMRKSTKGETAEGKERQEKSIAQQREEIVELAKKGKYEIIRWHIDEGVSGWKRGAKRPSFNQILTDARERGDFKAILCDDLDRFSRAEVMEVFGDLSNLSAADVEIIHCVNQGECVLKGGQGIGEIVTMVIDVHGGNEYSRKLGRRICLSQRNRARQGKRSSGPPYGMVSDGKGGLKPGDKKKSKSFDESSSGL